MKPAPRPDFTERLAICRLAFGAVTQRPQLSRAKFAFELGLEAEAYARYERGETTPTMDTLVMIRKLTGVSLDYLVADAPPGIQHPTKLFGECLATFAQRVKWLRELLEKDAAKVARAMGVSLETYRRWESGREPMPDDKQVEFAHRFSAELSFLRQGRPDGLPLLVLQRLLAEHPTLWKIGYTSTATVPSTKTRPAKRRSNKAAG